jgi:thiol-disulfide isomerase/thioredoxin
VAQSIMIVSLLRQVGSLLIRVGTIHSLDAGFGPEVGDPAPWLPETHTDKANSPDAPLLLAFMSTSCGTCDAIVPALNAVARDYARRLNLNVLLADGQEAVRDWRLARGLRPTTTSASEAFSSYEIEGTPYAFVIASDGRVAARGGINNIEHIEELLRRCEVTRPARAEPQLIELQPAEMSEGST